MDNIKLQVKNKELQAELNKLKKLWGQKENFKDEMLSAIKSKLTPIKFIKNKVAPSKNPNKRELIVMFNDLHLGLNVFPEEIGNVNEFNYTIASRRMACVIEQSVNFKPHNKSQISKVNLILNGDLICGINHGLNTKHLDLLVHQINCALSYFSHSITALHAGYPNAKLIVHGVSGNHSDSPHKREGSNRVVTEKFDNAENYIFYALSHIFSENPHISFNFPYTPYILIDLPAGRAMVTHGDLYFSKQLGSIGRNLNIKGLSEEIHKFSLGEIKKKQKPIDLVLLGHTHVFANFNTFHGTEVFVAPSLSGTDGYAHSLNINSNSTGQVVFESTNKFIMGDKRLIRVTDADHRTDLDKIIPVFTRSLKYEE